MATLYGHEAAPGRTNRIQDWCNLLLAVWLFISPWVLQFGGSLAQAANSHAVAPLGAEVSRAAWNAWILGVLMFLAALAAISRMEFWREWITFAFGVWIFVAPWALGFTHLAAASWDHWVVGALILLISLSGLASARDLPPDATAAKPPRPADRR
ncbi:MAG TPA: SPW repeat protein [Terriglobales bacterium]|nr:SPW repeat protein [Terriglobales bacterium]